MAKIKGFFKGIKCISQIFVVKEHEMEIGFPTDVRHVAHVGWDNSSVNAPTWMNEFKTSSDFSSTTVGNFAGMSRETSWASQGIYDRFITNKILKFLQFTSINVTAFWNDSADFDHPKGLQQLPLIVKDSSTARLEIPRAPKTTKRKKSKYSFPSSLKKSSSKA
ncbi:hypothetical protein J5N97_011484 [Dioscorea zingiberensis]|uniref:CRIB domain-containing protein n=1 Tax=Dioscorea zingiberensis TaxID=325984 RepID=A0A9D5HNL6_9LILI|nr:hypothetical protein J5N97_011433 [Dioscorea zingiberensis]KAJ0983229.1 hypothetical protein J5N97_011484 [Dioscorea zingiberensis]